jgi:hypothetical protein
MNPLRILSMLKTPPDQDQFRHFRTDPPDIKLKAWNGLQRRLVIRDIAQCVAGVVVVFIYFFANGR